MARLISKTSEIPLVRELPRGVIRIGRKPENDVQILESSISGNHCELEFDGNRLVVRDLGSTNGTFVSGQRIREAEMEADQILRLGNVDLAVEGLVPRVAIPKRNTASLQEAAGEGEGEESLPPGIIACQRHRSLAAEMECGQCGKSWCGLCLRELGRVGGARLFFCPECSGKCRAIGASQAEPERSAGFFGLVGNALVYPLQKGGLLLLLLGALVFAVGDFAASIIPFFGLLISMATLGYLFAYLQTVVSSSAQGEDEMPGWPEFTNWWEDLFRPFFLLAGTWAACLAPAILVMIYAPGEAKILAAPLLLFGLFYLPMGLMAVALFDTMAALNPNFIIKSISRVSGLYICVWFVVVLMFAISVSIRFILVIMDVPLVSGFASSFVALYFVTAQMRLLGSVYYARRKKLHWF